jgi:hypothetical protein
MILGGKSHHLKINEQIIQHVYKHALGIFKRMSNVPALLGQLALVIGKSLSSEVQDGRYTRGHGLR